MIRLYILILLSVSISFSQDCDDNMLMFDCDGLGFCNNEPGFGFDCYLYNEYCEDFNGYCSYLPQEFIFMYEGETRQYILYIPELLPPNAPLIFLMHGFTGSAAGMYNYSVMQSIAD